MIILLFANTRTFGLFVQQAFLGVHGIFREFSFDGLGIYIHRCTLSYI